MFINELKLKEMIQRKIKYIETSTIYNELEFKNVKEGELKAYREIIYDGANMVENEFINKYLKIMEHLNKRFEELDNIVDKDEIEQLTGYNNAIIFVLSLVNPKYEFEID